MRTVLTGLALVLLLAEASVNAAALKFAGVFSDHMVLQRGRAVPIWGWGDAGEEVAVEFHGQTKSATVDASGRWRVVLEALVADERGTELAVSSRLAGRRAKITDVVVGDVFVLGGQSNVTWWLSTSEGGAEATEAAAYPWLRQFESGFGTADEPMRDVGPGAGWKVCTPGTAGKFSGVGFFFARDLHERMGVPIGLLQTGVAATYGESWISRAAIEGNPALRSILDRYEKALRDLPRKEKEWEAKKAEHAKRVAEAKAAGRPEPEAFKAAPPMSRQNSRRPGALYHGRVAPLMPLAVRSIIWYQGEGDTQIGFAEHYHELLTTLVTTWRAGFGDPLLPVFIVQLPPLCYDDPWHSSPLVREAQLRVSREQSNCGLVTLLDEVEHKDIHPKNKRVVGERLARLARVLIFGEDIEASGPQFESMQVQTNSILLRFSHVGAGLKAGDRDLEGFTLCGADRGFLPARAEVTTRDTVRVSAAAVSRPVAVRYAWEPCPTGTLFNSESLPASPFRTDNFDTGHFLPAPGRKPTPTAVPASAAGAAQQQPSPARQAL